MDQLTFESYLEGLHEAGWRGEVGGPRFGYAATSALTYIIGYLYAFYIVPEEGGRAGSEQSSSASIEDHGNEGADLFRFVLELADEARGLLGSLDES